MHPAASDRSHYHRLCRIKSEYIAELGLSREFQPARQVISNLRLEQITNPTTHELARLFNHCYHTMMIMMVRFFAKLDETPAEHYGLQQIVFFPLMTMVVRPLGEVLTELPVTEPETEWRAGPTFEMSGAPASAANN